MASSLAQQDYDDYRQSPTRLNNPAEVKPTPIPILKQINKHNEDGSYTYGYEGADGSFKIETKLATGEVKGKYGYVDEDGKVRIVQYGAGSLTYLSFKICFLKKKLVIPTISKTSSASNLREMVLPYLHHLWLTRQTAETI